MAKKRVAPSTTSRFSGVHRGAEGMTHSLTSSPVSKSGVPESRFSLPRKAPIDSVARICYGGR